MLQIHIHKNIILLRVLFEFGILFAIMKEMLESGNEENRHTHKYYFVVSITAAKMNTKRNI
jgi:hypothetical protein